MSYLPLSAILEATGLSSSSGSALVGDAGGYTNFTPTAATIRGALQGIDSALASMGGGITALTGDGTATGPGSSVFTLATVNSSAGSFGSATSVSTFTVNGKGLITAISNTAIQIAQSQVTGLVSALSGKQSSLTFSNSIQNVSGVISLVGDTATPGNTQYYGTNGSGNLGYYPIPATGVTSVAVADDSTLPIYSVSGSPVTTSGTLAITLINQNANLVFASPASGSAAQPTFRSLVSADIPILNQNTTGNAATVTTNANLTGPVTSVGNVTSVTNNAIQLAMVAQIPTLTILGNNSGSTANVSALTVSQVNTLLGNTILSLGNLDSITANAKGAGLSSGSLAMQSASLTEPGIINTTTQTLAGAKTFSAALTANTTKLTNIQNASGVLQYNVGSGILYDGSALGSIALSRQLIGSTGSDVAVDWEFRLLQDTSSIPVLDFGQRNLNDTAGTAMAAWDVGFFQLQPGVSLQLMGSSSGTISILPQASAGTYNFNLPIIPGSPGQVLTSQGGGSNPMIWTTPGGISTVSIASANGFAGSSSGGSTPTLTLSTTITGLLKGNGTAISAATAGTDYSAGTSALTTGILKSTTSTGALTIAIAADFPTLNQNTTGSAASFTGSLLGDVTGTQSATAISDATVTGKLLTGYVSGAGTISATDSILSAIEKLNGNVSGLTTGVSSVNSATGAVTVNAISQLTGDGTAGPASGSASEVFTLANTAVTAGSYTNANITVDSKGRITAATSGTSGGVTSFNSRTGAVVPTSGDYTTSIVAEGTNLYFTNARAIASTLTGYSSTTGVISSSDSVLSAIEKLNGNQAASAGITALTGDVTASGSGSVAATLTATTNTTLTSLANLTTIGTITSGVWNGTAITIAHGGTGQTTSTSAFNALSPMTTLGDIVYGGSSPAGAGTRLAGNITAVKQFLTQTGTGTVSAAPVWGGIALTDLPTIPSDTLLGNNTGSSATPTALTISQIQTLLGFGGAFTPTVSKALGTSGNTGGFPATSASGTYTTPANVLYLRVRMVGAGGSGGGSGTSGAGNGNAGNNTTFGSNIAGGGAAGGNAGPGGVGGTNTLATGFGLNVLGGQGGAYQQATTTLEFLSGGQGGGSMICGTGSGGTPGGYGSQNAGANTGTGGGGAGIGVASSSTGSGGGGGGGLDIIITSPASTYSYSVGAGVAGGTAGASGYAGGNSGSGYIEITEYYANGAVGTATNVTGIVAVANGGTGLSAAAYRSINTQTGTTYTFALTDAITSLSSPLVTFGNAGATTVTVPLNSSVAFPVGTQLDCIQLGAGKVTFAGAGGVTVNSKSGNLSIGAQYDGVSLIQVAANTWVLMGDLIV